MIADHVPFIFGDQFLVKKSPGTLLFKILKYRIWMLNLFQHDSKDDLQYSPSRRGIWVDPDSQIWKWISHAENLLISFSNL